MKSMSSVSRRRALEVGGRSKHSFPSKDVGTKGDLTRLRPGIYAEDYQDADAWTARLHAHVLQSGPDAVVGLRSAARLHQLDGFSSATQFDSLTRHAHHARASGVYRTRTLLPEDIVWIDGFPTTSLARTLLDLGRVVGPNHLELALESALRGPNPGKPYEWNVALLEELHQRTYVVHPRTGGSVLRQVLRRRPPGARPTGSYAETTNVQGMRSVGLGFATRQADLRFFNPDAQLERELYPDILVDERLAIVEVNGAGPRNGATMTKQDVARMNYLSRVFRVIVVAGVDAGTPRSAGEIRAAVEMEPLRTFPCEVRGHLLVATKTGFDVHALR
jgi:hypothetical protein